MRRCRNAILAAAIAASLTWAAGAGWPGAARADTTSIIAVVNDQPITELDLRQRIILLEILGSLPRGGMNKQQALQALIDDQAKLAEATRFAMVPTDTEISQQITRVAKGMGLSREQLLAKLKERGISEATFRRYVQTTTAFNRLSSARFREDVKVTDAEVDAKLAEVKSEISAQTQKVMNDPRMKPVTIYSLMEISLPVDSEDPMLLQSRAMEAQQVLQRFKGCDSLRAASKGVFDVRPGKKMEADASKLPKPMKTALDKAGVGRAIGPMRGKDGIQLIAFCGVRTITPPKPDFEMPSREQVEQMVINQKYDKLEQGYLEQIRDRVYVEYRDPSFAQP
ncbi:MAG: SurA N-terminal domain-containing protein [Aestuariivirga sp.]|uniref:SurA N-terminal domain-containing protein n=1 Tax=Aestuariivirga sp. TaxID=2650926 RepID=UPI0038D14659